MGYSGAEGKLIHEKNQKQKILWHSPFKITLSGPKWTPKYKKKNILTPKSPSHRDFMA